MPNRDPDALITNCALCFKSNESHHHSMAITSPLVSTSEPISVHEHTSTMCRPILRNTHLLRSRNKNTQDKNSMQVSCPPPNIERYTLTPPVSLFVQRRDFPRAYFTKNGAAAKKLGAQPSSIPNKLMLRNNVFIFVQRKIAVHYAFDYKTTTHVPHLCGHTIF